MRSAGRLLPPVPQVMPLIMEWITSLMRSRDLRLQALTHQDMIRLDRSIVGSIVFGRALEPFQDYYFSLFFFSFEIGAPHWDLSSSRFFLFVFVGWVLHSGVGTSYIPSVTRHGRFETLSVSYR